MAVEIIERVAETATAGTYSGSGLTLFGVYSANDLMALGGLVFAGLSFAVNWYFRQKTYAHLVRNSGNGNKNDQC
ncbi:MAG: holin [Bermanella sp.]